MGESPYDATGLGKIWLVWSEMGLVRLELSGEAPTLEDSARPPEKPIPPTWHAVLDAYFAGAPVEPAELPVDLRGTEFQLKVWEALRHVPRGKVRSYGGIATDIGSPRAMRAVGTAAGINPVPIVVPCHRVVAHGNLLGGYSGGLDKKRFLLKLEGVDIEGDQVRPGQLDMF